MKYLSIEERNDLCTLYRIADSNFTATSEADCCIRLCCIMDDGFSIVNVLVKLILYTCILN